MSGFSFSHLSGPQVLHGFAQTKVSRRASDALLLAYMGEIDSRKLFLDAGYPSMHAFCVGEFDATHDEAKNRIRLVRTALRFPAMFPMLSDGRLQLSVVLLLAPYLHPGNVDELLNAVANKNKMEVQRFLAQRFPRTELMSWTMGPSIASPTDPASAAPSVSSLPTLSSAAHSTRAEQERETVGVPERLGMTTQPLSPVSHAVQTPSSQALTTTHTPATATPTTPSNPTTSTPTSTIPAPTTSTPTIPSVPFPATPQTRVTPIAANAHGVQFMMDDDAHQDLEYLCAALGHEAPTVAHVFARALKALRREVDKRRSAATARPQRPRPRASSNPRRIPNHVRRVVWKRDQSQCTFVSTDGRRCGARSGLELDHIVPVAHDGRSTIDNLRLLCRAHNQHAADQVFGGSFMNGKREAAQRTRDRRRAS